MQEKPNIVFIMTDDQGPWAFGAAGDLNARTPNLDQLCKQGCRLTNYFGMSAVCSPSRACLITSRYSTEVGIPDFIPNKESNIGLDKSFPTWPSLLTDAGYETALIGKWHLGSSDEHHPTCHGYQEFKGFRIGAGTSKNPKVEVDGQLQQMEGYTPDILTDFAIEFIHRKRSNPFMLSLHFWAPHANTGDCKTPEGDRTWHPLCDADWKPFKNMDPWIPNPDYPNLDIPRIKRMTREYMASIASVDRNIGRILDVLDKLKLSDNTLIVFTSDNGYNLGHNGIWHKGNGRWILTNNRGDRPNLYDNTLRLPAIVRWPGVIPPNTVINETISNLDWFPTLTSIGGASLGEHLIRGRNFLSLLRGIPSEWNNDLFAQYSMWDWHQTGADLRAYRTTQWKLVRDFNHADKDELYNLVDDPNESHNLMGNADITIRNIRDSLNEKLLASMQHISDPVITHREP